jgi:hypothetical protein
MRARILPALGAAALLCFLAGCAPQTPPETSAAASSAMPSAPLEEPFRSVLVRWNYYRASAGVPPIVAEPALNDAALHHAKYLVNNHIEDGDAVFRDGRMIETGGGPRAHSETPGNPWYTADGDEWANFATVIRGPKVPIDGAALVDGQAARVSSMIVVDPQLAAVGFGLFCVNDDCAGVIVYRRGLAKSQFLTFYEGNSMDWNPMLGAMPYTSARLRKAIEFPPAGIEFPSREERRGETPDPITSCRGYSDPVGVPIILELGAPSQGDEVKVSSGSLDDNGSALETCTFDGSSYSNPDANEQMRFRRGLNISGAVVMIPKNPLQPGHTYTVNIVADSQPYTWSFSIAPDAN